MRPFQYLAPESVAEALDMLAEFGPRAMVMAGGTDVVVALNEGSVHPECIIHLSKLDELRHIKRDDGCFRIGPLTTMNELAESKLVQENLTALAEAAASSAAPQVRNLGTIGGNLGTASPAGDLVTALVALGAAVKLASRRGEAEVPVEEFLVGPKKNILARDQLITEIKIPSPPPNSGSAFLKLGKRKAMSISIASAAAALTVSGDGKVIEEIRVAMGSLAPTVVRARKFETALRGMAADPEAVKRAADLVREDIEPITDVRASAWYRKEVAGVLAARSVEGALAKLKKPQLA
jgi:carbon-monoxide dehydrogenase medium subunit